MRRALWMTMVAAGVLGCGGDDDTGGDGDLAAVCEESCAHAVECRWTDDQAGCTADCVSGADDMFRDDAMEAQAGCLAGLGCETDNPGETCYVEVVAELEPHAIHEEYHADCTAADAECGDLPGDVCAIDQVVMFTDDYMETEVMPCLELSCDALAGCLEDKVLDAF